MKSFFFIFKFFVWWDCDKFNLMNILRQKPLHKFNINPVLEHRIGSVLKDNCLMSFSFKFKFLDCGFVV